MPDLRRGELTRRTPLTRGAGPERRSGLQRSGQLRRKVPLKCIPPAGARTSRGTRPGGFPPAVVAAAHRRADGRCELCGLSLGPDRGVDHSLHHRRPRGMGGTSDEAAAGVANVLVICGSGTTGCHGRVEQYRSIAMQAGWLLRQHQDPATTPVQVLVGCRMSRVLLAADGTYGEVPGRG